MMKDRIEDFVFNVHIDFLEIGQKWQASVTVGRPNFKKTYMQYFKEFDDALSWVRYTQLNNPPDKFK